MKLQWLQQFHVTARSSKSEKNVKELEEEGWNEALEINSKFQKLVVVANHQNQKKEEKPEIENFGNREEGSINEPEEENEGTRDERLLVAEPAKQDGSLYGSSNSIPKKKSKSEKKLEEVDMVDADRESLTEEKPSEPPDGGVFKGSSRRPIVVKREADYEESPVTATTIPSVQDLVETSLFLVVEMRDNDREGERSCGNEKRRRRHWEKERWRRRHPLAIQFNNLFLSLESCAMRIGK